MRWVALAVAWCAAASVARADDGYLQRLAASVRSQLDDAAAAHRVVPVPPVRVKLRWNPQRLGSLDLGAPVAAVAGADLDGDGRAELYVVTAREVVAIAIDKTVRELGRVAFAGDAAVPASRDPVGTAVVDGAALIASSSAWARELRVEWRNKVLVGTPGAPGFRACGANLALAPGLHHFGEGTGALYGVRCRDDLVDRTGYPLQIRGELSTAGTLDVRVARCEPDGALPRIAAPLTAPARSLPDASRAPCRPPVSYEIKVVGFAFDIADVERDGTPDAIVASASAPGEMDEVSVIPLAGKTSKPTVSKTFRGGVAGLVAADGDGDGVAEVIAVVRLPGATRVDLWRLDEPWAP